MASDLLPMPAEEPPPQRPARLNPLRLTRSALLNGLRWLGSPGSGKTFGLYLLVWQHLWQGLPAIVIDPTGTLCGYLLNKVRYFPESVQRPLWARIKYVDLAATDYIVPMPLYVRRGHETLFAAANRFPEVLKRQDPDLTSAPILGWNSLLECAIYAGQLALALGRQLDFVADLILSPQRYKEPLRQALDAHPELARAVSYFRQLMDPTSHALRERRTGSLLTKLVPFLSDPLLLATFAAPAPGIDWAEAVRQGQTVLLDVGGETDRERRQFKLLWCFLEIVEFLKRRGPAGREAPVLLVLDEIASLLNERSREQSLLAADLNDLITVWARNTGVKVCCANQFPSQLDERINHALAQLGTQVIGNIQHPDDALSLARQFHRYDPYWVRKTEPVWMNVEYGRGRLTYSAPTVIDERSVEFGLEEQYALMADRIRTLAKFHFFVRPAAGEGNLTGTFRRMSLAGLDAGLYPDAALLAEVRRRLRRRDGIALATLLATLAERQQDAIAMSTPTPQRDGTSTGGKRRRRQGKNQDAILKQGDLHDQPTTHPLSEPDKAATDEAWQSTFWQ